MNPNYGYQLHQAQRVSTRAQVLAADAQRGHQAAAVTRGTRQLARAVLGRVLSRAYRLS